MLKTVLTQFDFQLSVQLWSVKDELEQDFTGTLQNIADMGFHGVEFAGFFGDYSDSPQTLNQYLSNLGLSVSGAHVGFEQLSDELIAETARFYQALACPVLIIPYDERAFNEQGIDWVIQRLNQIAKVLKQYDILVGYHNHAQEFRYFKESTYWDYLAQHTSPDVVLQLDAGWARFAEQSPAGFIKKYPGRAYTTHYKVQMPDYIKDKQPFVGVDILDWKALIKANFEYGATRWLVIEQEDYPAGLSQLAAVKQSKQNLDAILNQFEFDQLERKMPL
ncbi:sugar phosphate isomerase/epimerase [Catenovulum sp. 2E275]|uniref:sugar phosphate isomerase/epimerase family protein n=1 Tax=Catenovulum sp. 2E275 TaxID=2980497 RepID=UPI0021D184DC|nr:sugar phosphate isomerase/epimerase [Catenovulum sp. 2E275]MCU4675951.1 sugar phosphate isomerase/epimerase [Catenovulum sp. 2E275]